MRLILVRHCESAIDPSTPAHTWGLSDRGHGQADRLAQLDDLKSVMGLACGPEPKMIATLEPAAQCHGLTTVVDDRFRETDGRGWLSQADFDRTVWRLFDRPDESPACGWESASDAGKRMSDGVDAFVSENPDGDVAVCSGGRALTSLLVTMELVAIDQAYEHWRSILMSGVAVLDFAMGASAHRFSLVSQFGTQAV